MEINNEERNDVFNETSVISNGEQEMKKSNLPKIIIGIVVLVLVVAGVALGVNSLGGSDDFFGPKMFASKGQRFVQLATTDQKLLAVLEENDDNIQINSTFKSDIDGILEQFGGEATGLGVFNLENKEMIKKEDFTNVTSISFDGVDDLKLEIQIVKDGDLIGVNIPEITDKFIGIDASDIEGLLANLEELGFDVSTDTEELTEEQQDELYEILKKYVNVAANSISDFVEKEANKEVAIAGRSTKATEHLFRLNGESLIKAGLEIEKELLKNEKDIEKLVELGFAPDKDELIAALESDIEVNEGIIKEESYDEVTTEEILVKLYEKGGKNIATVIEVDGVGFGFYMFETSKDNYDLIVGMNEGEEHEMLIIWSMTAEKNKKNGNMEFKLKAEEEEYTVTLCEVEIEELNKVQDEMIKLTKDEMILLNTITEDELNEFANDISANLEEFMSPFMVSQMPNYDYDYDYELPDDDDIVIDYDEEEEPKEDINQEEPEITKPKNGVLADAQKLFDKVDLGMTEDEVIKAIGEPTDEFTGSYSKTLYYENDIYMELLNVKIRDGKVIDVSINVFSDDYSKVYIGKELGTTVKDLNNLVGKVKEDMTLSEVEEILGDKYFQSEKEADGINTYTWYDVEENELSIAFEDGKVWLVYDINEMF